MAFHVASLLCYAAAWLLGAHGWVTRPTKNNRCQGRPLSFMAVTNTNDRRTNTALFSSNKLVIVGMGRSGKCIAQSSSPHFDSILGTTTATLDPSTKELPDCVQVVHPQELWEACHQSGSTILDGCSHILVTIPGTETDLPVLPHQNATNKVTMNTFYNSLIDTWVTTTTNKRSSLWLGILSTTAVYGNFNGQWVTEGSECRGSEEWRDYEASWEMRFPSVHIFRCSGIYGNTRSALHTVFRAGKIEATAKRQDIHNKGNNTATPVVTNRIHEEDLAQAIVASMLQTQTHHEEYLNSSSAGTSKNVYNLADNCPEARGVVMQYAAQLLLKTMTDKQLKENQAHQQSKSPNSDQKATPPSARSKRRGKDHKLVDNTKMRQKLLQDKPLLYPTYKEGLESILCQPDAPWNACS